LHGQNHGFPSTDQPLVIEQIQPGSRIERALFDLEERNLIVRSGLQFLIFFNLSITGTVDCGRATDIDKSLDILVPPPIVQQRFDNSLLGLS